MKLDNDQFFICTVKVIDDNTVEVETNRDTYYIHPTAVRFVRLYNK